jgi:hypothetical protein
MRQGLEKVFLTWPESAGLCEQQIMRRKRTYGALKLALRVVDGRAATGRAKEIFAYSAYESARFCEVFFPIVNAYLYILF